ncbi:AsmA family protein [Rhodobacteraceae bacterium HSP-20]|uniref:AsmA family protein n=1 Tax=Paragemmobacter amnigenus TaxID=2852097 RepID=A0ABS6J4Y1_9RHOB|nr:AsmA family protein [Rhodobacter amnigenus]MBU9697455.1 AsmA family protein [Rhodobacter amnigenus]MBV4388682.1 AsmA family protein [Rhodobacter amnigenus]
MRWLFRVVGGLVVLALLGMAALVLIPSDRVAALAVGQFEKVTGRKLVIEGAVKPTLWPVLGVETGRITISNADWSDEGAMLTADALAIRIDAQALFGGAVRITGLELTRPEILIEKAEEGTGNWVFGGDQGGTATADMAGADTPFTLDQGVIRDGSIGYIDHATGRTVMLTGVDLEMRLASYDGPLEMSLTAETGGGEIAADLTLGAFRTAYEGGVSPVTLSARAGKAQVDFDGRAGFMPLVAEGTLDADLADLAAVSALLGLERPALPQGFGAESVQVAGALTLTAEGSAHLRGGRIVLDGTAVTGDLDLTQGEARPKLVARLETGDLAVARNVAGGSGAGEGGGAVATAGWSDRPIDLSGLGALDADLGLRAASLALGPVTMGPVAGRVTVDRARAVVTLDRAGAYGGTVTGDFVLNARKGLSVGGNLAFREISLQPMLTDLTGYGRLVGSGDLTLDFLGSGNSVDAIMRSLSGSGVLNLGAGAIEGLDIAGMIRTLDTGYVGEGQRTVFDSLSASFDMDGGDLFNRDLLMAGPVVSAEGAGRIGLGARDLEYRIRPTALRGADGTGGISVPLWITGSWAAPNFALDLEALAQENLADEAAALEDGLKAKAAEELDQQEGESLEDAARRKLQEELGQEAGDLLLDLLGGGGN